MLKTHQVVDFGQLSQDTTLGYPFEGTELECIQWIEQNQPEDCNRYALQEISE